MHALFGIFSSFILPLAVVVVAIPALLSLGQCRSDIAEGAAAKVELQRVSEIADRNRIKAEKLETSYKASIAAHAKTTARIAEAEKVRNEALSDILETTDEAELCPINCLLP